MPGTVSAARGGVINPMSTTTSPTAAPDLTCGNLAQRNGHSPQRAHGDDNDRWRLPPHEQDEPDQRHREVLWSLDRTGPDGRVQCRAEQPHDGGVDAPHDGL